MRLKTLSGLLVCAVLASPAVLPTQQTQKYKPEVGQEGKDVIWVPTPEELVEAMLDMAQVTAQDYVVDLGAGDGRIAIAAAKRGARALGVEFNPDMVALSRENAVTAGVGDKAAFLQGDIFETDFSRATVVTMYLLPDLNLRLRPRILEMKPGTRVVSHSFSMGEWEADRTVNIEYRTAYLWIVPANVEGTWTWTEASGDAELTLRQSFQKVEGRLTIGSREHPLTSVKLEGDRIVLAVGEDPGQTREYSGRIESDILRGTVKVADKPAAEWSAKRR